MEVLQGPCFRVFLYKTL